MEKINSIITDKQPIILKKLKNWKQKGYSAVPHSILYNTDVPAKARFLYIVLMSRAFRGKNKVWPSTQTIAEEIGNGFKKRHTVAKYLNLLTDKQWIKVSTVKGNFRTIELLK